jgi:hypothetical protein
MKDSDFLIQLVSFLLYLKYTNPIKLELLNSFISNDKFLSKMSLKQWKNLAYPQKRKTNDQILEDNLNNLLLQSVYFKNKYK